MSKRLCVLSLAVLALAFSANRAAADWGFADNLPGHYITYVPQKVTCWEPQTFYRDVETTVEEPTYRTVTKQFNVTVLEQDFRDEEHEGTFSKFVPRGFDVEVLRWRLVPVTARDPLTGTTFTYCLPESYVQKQHREVIERVEERRKYMVRVVFYRPVEKTYEQDFVVTEMHPKKVLVREPFSRLVPYEASVLVPVYIPARAVTRVPCCP